MPVTIDDIRAAAKRIAGAVEHTPFVHSRTLSKLTGAEIFLKFENLQFTASFKERGALNKLVSLSEAERKRGVIAMSAGNHAQAVAYHAARLRIPAVIVMPKGSPNTKVRNTRVHGAEVVQVGGDTIAEGIAVKDVGEIAFSIIKKLVEGILVVEEETIERGVVALIEIEKTVAEGAGAAALAALLEHPQRFTGKRVGLPIS